MQNANNPDRFDDLDQFTIPANDNADGVNRDLENGHYISAESSFLNNQGGYTDAELEELNRSSEIQIRNNSPEILPEGDLSENQTESAMKAAGDEEIVKFEKNYNPGIQEIDDGAAICAENEIILKELDEIITEASKEGTKGKVGKILAFPFPAIGAIYSLLKGSKMKKKLKKLNRNFLKLKNIDERLKAIGSETTLDPDKISPDKGHVENIAGSVVSTVGYGIAGSSPIGIGLVVGGTALGIYGLYKVIKSYQNVTATQESLEEFKRSIADARVENGAQSQNLQNYANANTQGCRENIQENFPGILAA